MSKYIYIGEEAYEDTLPIEVPIEIPRDKTYLGFDPWEDEDTDIFDMESLFRNSK